MLVGKNNIYPGPIEDMFKSSNGLTGVSCSRGGAKLFMAALIVPDFEVLKSLRMPKVCPMPIWMSCWNWTR